MTVVIRSDEYRYPEFIEGQVLTHNDLNILRDFLYTKYAFRGQSLWGFGVGCGLDGSISGSTLRITPGFAVAGHGRELIRETDRTFALGSITPDTTSYPFIESGPGGYTAIIRPTEVVEESGGTCDESGCTTHTRLHQETAEIVLVAGRLNLGPLLGSTAFTLTPIVPRTNPTLTGFPALRDALYTALSGLVEQETRDLLKALKLEGPKGIDLLKVGIVNEVLYTLWDYLLCKQTESVPCFGQTLGAVALGWLHQSGTTWSWECRYRHHFQVSLALYRAIRGYTCQDLCDRYLDHIRVLVEDFTPPAVPTSPPAGGTTTTPDIDVHICTLEEIRRGDCYAWHGRREDLPYEVTIDPNLGRGLPEGFPPPHDGGDPPDWYRGMREVENVTDILTTDPLQLGVITAFSVLGYDGEVAAGAIEDAITGAGLQPDVTVMPEGDLAKVVEHPTADAEHPFSGGEYSLMATPSDSIALGVNSAGFVTMMATVPTSKSLGQISDLRSDALGAKAAADLATLAVSQAETRLGNLEDGMEGVQRNLESFPDAGEMQHAVSLDERVSFLEGAFEGGTRTSRSPIVGGPSGGIANTINASIYQVLDTFRDAIKAGVTQRAGPTVRDLLETVEPEMAVMKRASVSGTLLTEAEPEAVLAVIDSLNEAVVAMGVDPKSPEMKEAVAAVAELKSALGIG
jgi:hypothetical protein